LVSDVTTDDSDATAAPLDGRDYYLLRPVGLIGLIAVDRSSCDRWSGLWGAFSPMNAASISTCERCDSASSDCVVCMRYLPQNTNDTGMGDVASYN